MKFSESNKKTFCKNSNMAYDKRFILNFYDIGILSLYYGKYIDVFATISFNLYVFQATVISCPFYYRLIDVKYVSPCARP